MPAQIEARRLSGVDRGKHVRLMVPGGKYTGDWELAGEVLRIIHWSDGLISLLVLREDGPALGTQIAPETPVTITGKES